MILFNDLSKQWDEIKEEVEGPILNLLGKECAYIGGAPIAQFETELGKAWDNMSVAAVSSGTDAIYLAARALVESGKLRDEKDTLVLIQGNTYHATIVALMRALPNCVFDLVDIEAHTYQMNINVLKEKMRRWMGNQILVVPVHMYGRPNYMKDVVGCDPSFILEDCAQAQLVRSEENEDSPLLGTFGDIAATSFYPGKNLGGIGDGGAVLTNNDELKDIVLALRNMGGITKDEIKYNSGNHRLDTVNAIVLRAKLKRLEEWNRKRTEVAHWYNEQLLIKEEVWAGNGPHLYVRQYSSEEERNLMLERFKDHGVPTLIHYKTPIEEMAPFAHMGFDCPVVRNVSRKILSLPMHPYLSRRDIEGISFLEKWCLPVEV